MGIFWIAYFVIGCIVLAATSLGVLMGHCWDDYTRLRIKPIVSHILIFGIFWFIGVGVGVWVITRPTKRRRRRI